MSLMISRSLVGTLLLNHIHVPASGVLFAPRLSCMHGFVNTKSASATVCVLSFPMAAVTAGSRLQSPAQTHASLLDCASPPLKWTCGCPFFSLCDCNFYLFCLECDNRIHLLGLVCISYHFQ